MERGTTHTMNEFKEAKEVLSSRLMHPSFVNRIRNWIDGYPSVQDIGIGTKNESEVALKLFLSKPPTPRQIRKLDKGFEGLPIAYTVSGKFVAA